MFIAGCKSKRLVDPFPASGAVAGWEKTGETRVFAAKDLWQYIDGDAEQYISAGVVSTSTSDYKYKGQLEAVVDVYTMGDAAGARKILETGRRPRTPRPFNWAMPASPTRRASSSARALTWSASLPTNPRRETPQALLALAHGVEAQTVSSAAALHGLHQKTARNA